MKTAVSVPVCGAAVLALLVAGCAHSGAARRGFEPLRIIQTVAPVYPPVMIQRGINEGQASVLIAVDAQGNLVDRLLTRYSRASFAKEAIEALHQWRFEPARFHGVPIASRQEIHFHFVSTGQVVSRVGPEASEPRLPEHKREPEVRLLVEEAELDEPLRVDQHVPPFVPPETDGGRVAVDFVVDEYGRPRMLAVRESDDDRLSVAAVQALAQWRFADPLRGGQRVLARRVEVFTFPRAGEVSRDASR